MKRLLLILILLLITFLPASCSTPVYGQVTVEPVYTRHLYGYMIFDDGAVYENYPELMPIGSNEAVWNVTQNIAIIGWDAHLKANDHNSVNETSHASVVLRANEQVMSYMAAFDNPGGTFEQHHSVVMFPSGQGVFVDAGQIVKATGRGVGKTSGSNTYSLALTIYYVYR